MDRSFGAIAVDVASIAQTLMLAMTAQASVPVYG